MHVITPELSHLQREANCKGMNPDVFKGVGPVNTVLAKAACAKCLVREECLTYALDNNERSYIWGGHTPEERVQIQQGTRDRDDLSYLYVPDMLDES